MPPKWKPHWLMPDPRRSGSFMYQECDPQRLPYRHHLPPYRGSPYHATWANAHNASLPRPPPPAVKVEPAQPAPSASPLNESAFGKDPIFRAVNLVSTSKDSTFQLFGVRSNSFSPSQVPVIPAKRKCDENVEQVPKTAKTVESGSCVAENSVRGSPAVDQTVLIVPQAKNGEMASTTLNRIESSSQILQSKIRDAQTALDRLVARKKDDASHQATNEEESAKASTSSDTTSIGSVNGGTGSRTEKDPSSKTTPQPKRRKRHIEILEDSLSIQRPRGTWKEWDDDRKINVARWFGAHPEDLTPETLAKWELPGTELWPFFAEGAWQMPSIHVEYRLRPVQLGVAENAAETESEEPERFAEVFQMDAISAEGEPGENGSESA